MVRYPELTFTSIEPYISSIAEKVYEAAKNHGLSVSKSITTEIKQDVIFFIGIDLSISETFQKFQSDVLKLRNNFLNAEFVILECPDYEPSSWLIEIFAEDLYQENYSNFRFQDISGVSLDGFVLNRHLYIYRKKNNVPKDLTVGQEDLLIKYALFFNMSGTPIPEIDLATYLHGDTYQTRKSFNCWPVERNSNSGQIFTWLRPQQVINFPRKKKTLKFALYSMHEPRKYRSFGFTIEVSPNELIIRKSIFACFFNRLNFEYFVPRLLGKESTDIRQLSYAVTGYLFE
jgi:hypothetical protein